VRGGSRFISDFFVDAEFLRWGGASLYC
jgi:hypothetical protein